MFLFPLTSQKPDRSRPRLAISEIECRRGGLDYPSWLILDEYNRVQVDEACTRECLALVVDTSLSGMRVGREMDGLVAERGSQG